MRKFWTTIGFAALSISILVGGLFLYRNGIEEPNIASVSQRGTEMLRIAQLAAKESEDIVNEIRPLLAVIAQFPSVREKDAATCSRLLADLLAQHRYLDNISALDIEGNVYCSAVPLSGPVNYGDASGFQKAISTRAFAVDEYRISRITKNAILGFAQPLLDASGQPSGVVGASVNLKWLQFFAAKTNLPDGAIFTVVDRNGIILARYPDAEDFTGIEADETPLIKGVFAKGEGSLQVQGLDGKERVYGFTALKGVPEGSAFVLVGVPL